MTGEGSEGFRIYEKNWSIFFDFLVTAKFQRDKLSNPDQK